MQQAEPHPQELRETGFHPVVYAIMAGTVVWLVLVAWLLFGVDLYAGLMMIVVTFAALGFLAVPTVFWLLSGEPRKPARRQPLHEWAEHTFESWGDRMRARDAAINALVAPAAAALTLTLAGLVARWVAGGSP